MYLRMQLKRMLLSFPAILLSTLLLAIGIFSLCFLFLSSSAAKNTKKARIGLVGNAKSSYLGLGIGILEHMDSSRYSVEFISLSDNEAEKQLASGEITAFLEIPEDFLPALGEGRHVPLTFVTSNANGTLAKQILNEIADVLSVTIIHSEYSIYAMQSYLLDQNADASESTDRLNLLLLNTILKRNAIYDVEYHGIYASDTVFLYYSSSILLAFLLLWGINGGLLLHKSNSAISRHLQLAGYSASIQVLSEFAAYILALFLQILLLIIPGMVALFLTGTELTDFGINIQLHQLLLLILPVLLLIGSFHLFLYEWIPDFITAVISCILISILLAYISGCFYPTGFFPGSIASVGKISFTGAAFSYLRQCLRGEWSIAQSLILCLWTSIFLSVSMLYRNYRFRFT